MLAVDLSKLWSIDLHIWIMCVEPSTAKRWVELGFAEIKQNSTSSTTMNESNPDTTYEEQYPGAPPPTNKGPI